MTKQETCTYLRNHGIAIEVTEHSAVYNMAECAALALLYPEDDAKKRFVQDDKKRQYFLITVRGDRRVNLKQFRCAHGTRPLASPPQKSCKRVPDAGLCHSLWRAE